jgi:hypothetical protein
MATGFLSRLFTRIFAGALVREAYAGVLGREPDSDGFAAHTARVRRTGRLAQVLQTLTGSDEAMAGRSMALSRVAEREPIEGLKALSLPVLTQAYWGILGRAPDDEGLAAYACKLQQTGDLASLLAEISRSDEAWSLALQARAQVIGTELHAALRGVDGLAGDAEKHLPPLLATQGLRGLVEFLAQGPEHWRQLLRRNPEVLVAAAYVSLLDRQPGPEELRSQAQRLAETADLVEFLSGIGRSEEHAARTLQWRTTPAEARAGTDATRWPKPEGIVVAAFESLLGHAPEPEALARYSTQLRKTGNVAGFLAELSDSIEHRRWVVLRRVRQP